MRLSAAFAARGMQVSSQAPARPAGVAVTKTSRGQCWPGGGAQGPGGCWGWESARPVQGSVEVLGTHVAQLSHFRAFVLRNEASTPRGHRSSRALQQGPHP